MGILEAAGELVSGRDTSLLETLGIECLHGKRNLSGGFKGFWGVFTCVRA